MQNLLAIILLKLLFLLSTTVGAQEVYSCRSFLSQSQMDSVVAVEYDDFSIVRQLTKPNTKSKAPFKYFLDTNDGHRTELRKDATGLVISAQNSEIRNSVFGFIESLGNRGSLVFADINHLGYVNYFYRGMGAGDAYIEAVARALVEAAGPYGMVFRWGGDEFVILFNSSDRKLLENFGQQVKAKVGDKDGPAQQVFNEQIQDLVAEYKAIITAKAFMDVPSNIWRKFYAQEVVVAREDFEQFQRDYKVSARNRYSESFKKIPSVSLGGIVLDGRLTPKELFEKASQAAEQAKREYRQIRNLDSDLEKYIGRPSMYSTREYESLRDKDIPAIVIGN